MKTKSRPGSKILTKKSNTNKKRAPEVTSTNKKNDTSLFKKNEFALILFGALLLTLIISFFFFRSSDSKPEPFKKNISRSSFVELENRILKIEQTFLNQQKLSQSTEENTTEQGALALDPLKDRVSRLETAFSVKFDSIIEKMEKMEKSISSLKKVSVAKVVKKSEKKPAPIIKKKVKKEKKATMFHSVKKGETLYSISKKYNTKVATLRKLNNLSSTAKIYPGNNILIR